jgi:hypothetical protein
VLENPNDVGVSTVREIAEAAAVKPNTFVRMARQVGFGGYEDFREPFREAIRQGAVSFPDRARWLQDMSQGGDLGGLYADMVGRDPISRRPSPTSTPSTSSARPRRSGPADQVFTLGVGVNNSNARNFTYLASTGMVRVPRHPAPGSRHRRSRLGGRARRSDRDDLQALSPRGGRGRRSPASRA